MVQELSKVDHVTRGNAKFLYTHKDSQDLKAILLSGLESINELEDQVELMQLLLPLPTATGANLDYWGDLFNVPNRPEDDEEYRSLIYAFIITYYSNGDARSIRDSLLGALSCTEVNVYDSTPGRFIAMLYNPRLLVGSPEVIDTALLNNILSLASAAGVSSSGVVLVPGQFGYLEFEDQVSNAIDIPNENFEYWDSWRFNSGFYSNSDDGKRLFTTIGSDTKFSIISDDADFYDDIVATAGTALQSLGFKFYSGTIGTLNPRVEFRSASSGATTQLRFNMPDSSYADPFVAGLNAVMKTAGGEFIVYDKNGVKLTVRRIADGSSVTGLSNTTRTSNGVDYQRVQWNISSSTVSAYQIFINDVEITGTLEDISSAVAALANFNRTDESQFDQYNPFGITSSQVVVTGTGENIFFKDLEDNTWGFGVGTPVANSVISGEWNQTDFTLNNNIRNDTLQAIMPFPTTLTSGPRVIGTYTDENGSGIYFNIKSDAAGNDFVSDLGTTQMLTYYSSLGKPVTILTPGSTITDVATLTLTDDYIAITLRLFDTQGIRVLDAICMGSASHPDGWANAQDGYTTSQADVFEQYNPGGEFLGMDDIIDLSDLCSVTKNNEYSHSFELSTLYDDIYNTDSVAFTSANPWGLLKTYYVFAAGDARPIIPGRYAYLEDDGSGGQYLTGEDAGHLSTLYLQPDATNDINLETVPNVSSWASLSSELAGVTTSQRDYGYNVTAGQGDFPDRVVTNTWRDNVVKYIDYWKEEITVTEKAQIEAIDARLNPLDSNIVIYYDPPPPDASVEVFDMSSSASEGAVDPRDSSYGGADSSQYLAFKRTPDNFEDWRLAEQVTGPSQTCLVENTNMFCSPRIYDKNDGVYYTAERDKDYSDGSMGLDYNVRIEGFDKTTGELGTNVIEIIGYPKTDPAVYSSIGQKDISPLYTIVDNTEGGFTCKSGPDMICRLGNKLYILVTFFDHDLQTVSKEVLDNDRGDYNIRAENAEFWELDMLTLNLVPIASRFEYAIDYSEFSGVRKFFHAVGDGLFYTYIETISDNFLSWAAMYHNLEQGYTSVPTIFGEIRSFPEQIMNWSAQPVCATLDNGEKSHSVVLTATAKPIDTNAFYYFNPSNNQKYNNRIFSYTGTSSSGYHYSGIYFFFQNINQRNAFNQRLREAFEYYGGPSSFFMKCNNNYSWEFRCVNQDDYNILTPRTHTGDELFATSYDAGIRIQGGYSDGTNTNYFEVYRNGVKMAENNTIPGFGNYDYGDLASYNSKNPNGIRIVYDLGWKMKHIQWGEKYDPLDNRWYLVEREFETSYDDINAGTSLDYTSTPINGSGSSFVDTQEDRNRTIVGVQYDLATVNPTTQWMFMLYNLDDQGYLTGGPSFHKADTSLTSISNPGGGSNCIGISSFAKPFEKDKYLGTKMYFTLRAGSSDRDKGMLYLADISSTPSQSTNSELNTVLIAKTGDSLGIEECDTTWVSNINTADYRISTESRNLMITYGQWNDVTDIGYGGYNPNPVMRTGFAVWSDSIITYAFKSDIVTVTDVGLSSATLSKLFLTAPKTIWELDGQLSLLQNGVDVVSLTGKTSQDVSAAQGDTFQLSLTGRWDPAMIENETYVVYNNANQPQVEATLSKSPMDGKSVNFALNYLYPLISGFDGTRNIPLLNFNFLGGTETYPAFETFVSSLSTAKTHLQENIVMTAGTPVTITHNLGEKLVVLKAYSGNSLHTVTKVLVDTNSLTIESATNATVSIIIKA